MAPARRTTRVVGRGKRAIRVTCWVHFIETQPDEEVRANPSPKDVPNSKDEATNTTEAELTLQRNVQPAVQFPSPVPIRQWTYADMEGAVKSVEENNMSIKVVAIKWGMPPSSLREWLLGQTTTNRRVPRTILTEEEETEVVEWCKDMARLGHRLQVNQLQATVSLITASRPNPFTNGVPGRSWWAGFQSKHPNLTIRTVEGVDNDRAIMVRSSIVQAFYDNLKSLIKLN